MVRTMAHFLFKVFCNEDISLANSKLNLVLVHSHTPRLASLFDSFSTTHKWKRKRCFELRVTKGKESF